MRLSLYGLLAHINESAKFSTSTKYHILSDILFEEKLFYHVKIYFCSIWLSDSSQSQLDLFFNHFPPNSNHIHHLPLITPPQRFILCYDNSRRWPETSQWKSRVAWSCEEAVQCSIVPTNDSKQRSPVHERTIPIPTSHHENPLCFSLSSVRDDFHLIHFTLEHSGIFVP